MIFDLKDEASKANLNAGKRILKCQPFLHRVHEYLRFRSKDLNSIVSKQLNFAVKVKDNAINVNQEQKGVPVQCLEGHQTLIKDNFVPETCTH